MLLERAAGLGVTGLDDLLTLPTIAGHAQATKLSLTNSLPRCPGVYLFRDRGGRVLYVGKATNLRSRVRSYFSGDTRRKVGQLLRETQAIDHFRCATTLEAAVREVRLIHEHEPRFNRQGTTWQRYPYLKLTLNEPFPRLSVVRVARDDGALYLGPLASTRVAKRVAEAIETVVPLRRCTATPAEGVTRGAVLVGPARRVHLPVLRRGHAGGLRRDRGPGGARPAPRPGAAARAAGRPHAPARGRAALRGGHRRARAGHRAGPGAAAAAPLRCADGRRPGGGRGRRSRRAPSCATAACSGPGASTPTRATDPDASGCPSPSRPGPTRPASEPSRLRPPSRAVGAVPRELADELTCVAAWLDAQAGNVRLLSAEHGLASPLPRLPTFAPRRAPDARRARAGLSRSPAIAADPSDRPHR